MDKIYSILPPVFHALGGNLSSVTFCHSPRSIRSSSAQRCEWATHQSSHIWTIYSQLYNAFLQPRFLGSLGKICKAADRLTLCSTCCVVCGCVCVIDFFYSAATKFWDDVRYVRSLDLCMLNFQKLWKARSSTRTRSSTVSVTPLPSSFSFPFWTAAHLTRSMRCLSPHLCCGYRHCLNFQEAQALPCLCTRYGFKDKP